MIAADELGFPSAIALMLALALGGCASLTISDTKPLSESRLEPPGSEHISRDGYRLDALATSPATPDLLVINRHVRRREAIRGVSQRRASQGSCGDSSDTDLGRAGVHC